MINDKNRDFLARFGSEKHINQIIDHPDVEGYSLGSNPFLNDTHIDKMISEKSDKLPDVISNHRILDKLSDDTVLDLAKNGGPTIQRMLSFKAHQLNPHHIDALIDSLKNIPYDYGVRRNLGEIHGTPEQFDKLVAYNDLHLDEALARNKNLPEKYIHHYVNSHIPINRQSITSHPKLKIHHMEKLSDDENKFVRMRLATRKDLPSHLVDKLAKDPEPIVTSEVYMHHRVSKNATL